MHISLEYVEYSYFNHGFSSKPSFAVCHFHSKVFLQLKNVLWFYFFRPRSLELFRKRKIEKSEQLRTDMQSTNYEEIEKEKFIFVDFPSPAMHTGHETGDVSQISVLLFDCTHLYVSIIHILLICVKISVLIIQVCG